MKTSPAFDASYKGLNKEQKQAVDTIYGPVMVIAGPGTGKTTLLTLRIANILKETDASASSILALTFTESAVASMRQKLFGIIGTDAYRVHINTFHGFCNDIIRRYPEYFPRIIGSRNIREIEAIKMVREIIEQHDFAHIKPFGSPFHYVRDAVKAMQSLKREGITPALFREQIDEMLHNAQADEETKDTKKKRGQDTQVIAARNSELAVVYEAYEKLLAERKVYDFDDMLLDVVKALREHETLRMTLQEHYQFILADEHQDANASQNAVLELLCSYDDTPNLLIVGDEKQAIFRFQGASLENFLYFKERFPTAEVIFLTSNYRSGQNILDAAHSLITKGVLPEGSEHLRKPLIAGVAREAVIDVVACATEKEEIAYVINQLRAAHEAGTSWEEMAIIYRDNKDARGIAEALEKTDIPFAIHSNVNVLDDVHIGMLIKLLKLTLNPTNDMLLGESLFAPFFNLLPLDIYKVLGHAHEERIPVSRILASDKHLVDAEVEQPEAVYGVYQTLLGWSRLARTRPFIEVFDRIIRDSGFVAHVVGAPGSAESLKALEVLFEEAKSLSAGPQAYMVSDFLDHIAIMEEHGSTLKMLPDARLAQSVSLMTAHRAKGLEFEHVHIMGVTDGHWGNRRNRSLFVLSSIIETDDDDERRLLYVAVTRAKEHAILTFGAADTAGSPKNPSRFIEEMDAQTVTRSSTADIAHELAAISASLLFAEPLQHGLDIAEREYLLRLFEDQGLSVSALNNYLGCPWRYFFTSLLRVPQAPSGSSRFGNTVHHALRLMGEATASGTTPNAASTKKIIETAARKYALSEREEKQFITKALKVLPPFWENNAPQEAQRSLWEHKIEGSIDTPTGPLVVRGTIDRIDAGEGNRVTVLDYKTGKQKSRNDIMGQTKSSDGNYYRQLIFYRLLLGLEGERIADTGIIAFVEPDAKGRPRSEPFELTATLVDELKTTIDRVAGEIRTLAFWNDTCEDPKCEYCALGKIVKEKK